MKRLPFLTPAQRRALLAIEWVLLLVLIGMALWPTHHPLQEDARGMAADSVTRQITYAVEEIPVETFPFDPNTADSTTLLRLGLAPWQVRSIYRYRARHGRYHKPEDFMRLPGITGEQWERLKPYIRIAKKFQYLEAQSPKPFLPSAPSGEGESLRAAAPVAAGDTVLSVSPRDSFPKQEKIAQGETIDINTADTTLLKKIPGIASKRAARIVAYRKSLGGFVAVEQAMEATQLPDTVLKYMTVSLLPVQKININKLSVQQLMKHPYVNFYQAKAINEYRRNKGDLHSFEELSHLENFRPTDIDRLRPYVEF